MDSRLRGNDMIGDYLRLAVILLLIPASPARPEPSKSMVAGSGTGVVDAHTPKLLYTIALSRWVVGLDQFGSTAP